MSAEQHAALIDRRQQDPDDQRDAHRSGQIAALATETDRLTNDISSTRCALPRV